MELSTHMNTVHTYILSCVEVLPKHEVPVSNAEKALVELDEQVDTRPQGTVEPHRAPIPGRHLAGMGYAKR